jgi:uncharacterized protein YqjF (DUF2071 family)
MIRKISLSAILFLAGLLHLIQPEKFIPAVFDFLIYKKEIVYLTGIFEIFLAFGLLISKMKYFSAKITRIYFILLIPTHIYVSINHIEIFNVSNPILLWMRTFFQYVFILWAFSLEENHFVIEQVWEHVVFQHLKTNPEELQKLVPFKLDLYNGQAIVSIVPFYMSGIRFPFLPAIPKLSSLWELNLRTYVEVDGIKGIYFFTLETDSKIGEFVARNFFYLPYRFSDLKASLINEKYDFVHKRDDLNYSITARVTKKDCKDVKFNLWATERYSLFTKNKDQIFRGIVTHQPWELVQLNNIEFQDQFSKILKLSFSPFGEVSYSRQLKVRFFPFQEISQSSRTTL